MNPRWSQWRAFPDPRKLESLIAAFGPRCYELRHDRQLVLFGKGSNIAHRMTSLLPAPLGCGTRNNKGKRQYVLEHLADIQYRTLACRTAGEADAFEQELKAERSAYLFAT